MTKSASAHDGLSRQRFKPALPSLPMQDVPAAIAELERAVQQRGLVGAMIDDKVNARTYDDPQFLPFWQAAEALGALICSFIRATRPSVVGIPQPRAGICRNTIGNPGGSGHHLCRPSSIGGVLDQVSRFENLPGPRRRLCLFRGIGRMDRGWQVRAEARANINRPPSSYLNQLLLRLPDPQRAGPADVD